MLDLNVARACDRCYHLKERCSRDIGHPVSCDRCVRLGEVCTAIRSVRSRGRRSRVRLSSHPNKLVWLTFEPKQSPQAIEHYEVIHTEEKASTLPSLSSLIERNVSGQYFVLDEALLDSMHSIEHFQGYFILGRSFANSFFNLARRRIHESPELVREGSLACADAVLHARSKKSGFGEINFTRSATGLRKLRSANIPGTDTGAVLTLGLTLATFELITSGASAHAITQFTLSLVRPMYPIVCDDWDLNSEILCLSFMDTVGSMIRRQLPVIQYKPSKDPPVDRLVGLCAPLVPIMYEVCQFAHDSIQPKNFFGKALQLEAFETLSSVVTAWQPEMPLGLWSKFSPDEIMCLLSHARIYRLAISLVLHRLQFPFGLEDPKASRLSAGILYECSAYSSMVGEADKLPQTLFPWMVAAFEVTSREDRATLMQKELPKSREILQLPLARMQDSIRYVWKMRDEGNVFSPFDVLEHASIGVVPI